MQSGKRIEQIILTRSGGSIDALVVTEAPSGARQRERWPALAHDEATAIDRIVMRFAWRADVDGYGPKLRVRIGHGDALATRPDLVDRLRERWPHEDD